MNPRRKKRLAIVSSVLIGAAAVAGFSLYALNENFDLFFTPTEVVNGKADSGIMPVVGQRIRVGGMVVVGSVKRDSESLKVAFKLKDSGSETITIKYEKILPDLFREGQGIVAQGILTSNDTLEASEVLAKHDEEYMPKEIADAMGKEHKKPTY
ncbi:MAG: cytochrome c maturation protein CcmE [Thalassotalea sp.]|nr:cytochrome c maturation protein CcmE [Thalassotalea sp.]MDG2393140.1 cytochrome c maturation protein CcmE [Thalassotalea sp.]